MSAARDSGGKTGRESLFPSRLASVKGRAVELRHESDFYVATLRIVIEADSSQRYRENDVQCVAERALYAAGAAYNLAGAAVREIVLESIEEVTDG